MKLSRGEDHRAGVPESAARPFYFGPVEDPLCGFYHPPQGEPRECGVVLCHTLGYEYIRTYRTLRILAERLAGAGFPALRFDYHGTGDSAGDDRDPGRVQAWLGSIGTAIDELKRRSGAPMVSLFGLRIGATLALTAASGRPDVASIVLWSPFLAGRTYVREMRAFRLMAKRQDTEGVPPPEGAPGHGDEEAGGFLLTAETLADLKRLDLLALPQAPPPRALVMARDEGSQEQPLADSLNGRGGKADYLRVPGYLSLMVEPSRALLPTAVLDALVAWLSDVHRSRASAAPSPSVPNPQASSQPTSPAEWCRQVSMRGSRGGRFREELVSFGDGERIVGVLAQPPLEVQRPGLPAVILFNNGWVHRIGSNRMNVILARRWTGLGFSVLRTETGGMGDSRPREGAEDNVVYSKAGVDEARAAMAFLRQRGFDRFVLGGLCSGAYVSFHAALDGLPVVGGMMINPQTFYWRDGDSLELAPSQVYRNLREYERSTHKGEKWFKLLRGQVPVGYVLSLLASRARTLVQAKLMRTLRLLGLRSKRGDLGADLQSLVTRGAEVLLVFSGGDPGLDLLDLYAPREVARLRNLDNFRLEIIEGPDHTFTPLWTQPRLYEVLTEHLTRRYLGSDSSARDHVVESGTLP